MKKGQHLARKRSSFGRRENTDCPGSSSARAVANDLVMLLLNGTI
jgi:hypothetical protein